jgi:hypothetical protein
MTAGKPKLESQDSALGTLLYRLSVAFPGWAGAFIALYAISSSLAALRIRFR